LCVGSLHSDDQSQNTQAGDQSALHQTSSLSTSKCHSFYWVASTRIKSKRQRTWRATFFARCPRKILIKATATGTARCTALREVERRRSVRHAVAYGRLVKWMFI
jgi:hypothetical protein